MGVRAVWRAKPACHGSDHRMDITRALAHAQASLDRSPRQLLRLQMHSRRTSPQRNAQVARPFTKPLCEIPAPHRDVRYRYRKRATPHSATPHSSTPPLRPTHTHARLTTAHVVCTVSQKRPARSSSPKQPLRCSPPQPHRSPGTYRHTPSGGCCGAWPPLRPTSNAYTAVNRSGGRQRQRRNPGHTRRQLSRRGVGGCPRARSSTPWSARCRRRPRKQREGRRTRQGCGDATCAVRCWRRRCVCGTTWRVGAIAGPLVLLVPLVLPAVIRDRPGECARCRHCVSVVPYARVSQCAVPRRAEASVFVANGCMFARTNAPALYFQMLLCPCCSLSHHLPSLCCCPASRDAPPFRHVARRYFQSVAQNKPRSDGPVAPQPPSSSPSSSVSDSFHARNPRAGRFARGVCPVAPEEATEAFRRHSSLPLMATEGGGEPPDVALVALHSAMGSR